MVSTVEPEVRCPRCRYNLRGLTTPRCPECGFAFTFEELRTGLLRENIATWLDRCDPWQPHQVLVRSLYELLRGALRPRRLLTKLDVNGPLGPAWLMLVCGTFWLWFLTLTIVAVGIVWHTGASPAAAATTAALVWGPLLLLLPLVASLVVASVAAAPPFLSAPRPAGREGLRLLAYVLPTFASYGCIPLAVMLCVIPEFALGWQFAAWALAPIVVGIAALPSKGKARPPRSGMSTRGFVATLGLWLASLLAAFALSGLLWPDSLEPPWWVYFS